MPDIIATAVALFASWLFALAAWHKLRNPGYFAAVLRAYLPAMLANTSSARLIGLAELVLALFLLLPAGRGPALLAAAALLLGYAALMGWQLLRGRADLNCGCAGPAADTTLSGALVLRNLVCAALVLGAWQPLPVAAPRPLLSLVIALFISLVYLCFAQLHSNAQRFALEKV